MKHLACPVFLVTIWPLLSAELRAIDTKSEMLTFSDRTDDGLVILQQAVVKDVTDKHVVVVSTKTGDKINVPLARAAKNVQLKFRAGKEILEALAKLQAGGASAAELDSWQNSTASTHASKAAMGTSAGKAATADELDRMRLQNIERGLRRADHIDFQTRSIQATSQNALNYYEGLRSRATEPQSQRRLDRLIERTTQDRDSKIKLVPRNYDMNRR